MNLRKKLFTMAALLGAVMGLTIAVAAITPAASAATQHATLNKCGPQAYSTKQWRSYAARNDTWAHVINIVRKNASKYAFHPIDGDTVATWYNRQVVILRSARTQHIPNTGCTDSGEVQNISDKLVPKNWPLVVALPASLTKQDIHATRTTYYNEQKIASFYYLGQSTCINGTSKAKKVVVIYFIHVKVKTKKPAKPKKPAPKTAPGSCTAINSPGAVVCSSPTYINICGIQVAYTGSSQDRQAFIDNYIAENCPASAPPTPPTPPTVTMFAATATAIATVTVNCPAGSASATASATASASGSATSTVSQADANSKAQANAQANANATATASATAKCTPAPPPPSCQMQIGVTTINDLDAGFNSPNFRVTVTMCGNDTGTMNVSAQFGSVPGGNSVTVSGQNTYTFTYYAPGEVPPGGQDWVTVTVRDSVTGDVATASTPKFNINPPPPSS